MTTRPYVVEFAMSVCRHSTDWQQVQDAMVNNSRIRDWLEAEAGGDDMEILSIAQSVIHEAEERLGDKLPLNYA